MADNLKNSVLPRALSDVVADLADLLQKEIGLARAEMSAKLYQASCGRVDLRRGRFGDRGGLADRAGVGIRPGGGDWARLALVLFNCGRPSGSCSRRGLWPGKG